MRIRHALRRTSRCSRIHQRSSGVFRQGRPGKEGRPAVQKHLIAPNINPLRQKISQRRDRRRANKRNSLHQRTHLKQPAKLARQTRIRHNHLRLRVIHNVGNLILHQLHIQRREHSAFGRHSEHHLKMLRTVVHQGGNTLITINAQLIMQRIRKRTRTRRNRRKRSLLGLILTPRGALGGPMHRTPELQNTGDGERHLLHRRKHAANSSVTRPQAQNMDLHPMRYTFALDHRSWAADMARHSRNTCREVRSTPHTSTW